MRSTVSSSTPLAKEASFTSEAIRRQSHHETVEGQVLADKAGKLNIEQSMDGENWDVGKEIEVAAGKGQGFEESLSGRYWRLRYVNGADAQGTLRLSAVARPTRA